MGDAPQSLVWSAVGPGRRSTGWLVVEHRHPGSAPPILGSKGGRRVLAVFGFDIVAGLFARLSRRGGRAVLRIGRLGQLLRDPPGGVDLVDAEAAVLDGPVSLTRQRFPDFLLGPGALAGKDAAGARPSKTRQGEARDAAVGRGDARRGGGKIA